MCPPFLHRDVAKAEDPGSLVPNPSSNFQFAWRDTVSTFRNVIQQAVLCVCRSEVLLLFREKEDKVPSFRATVEKLLELRIV